MVNFEKPYDNYDNDLVAFKLKIFVWFGGNRQANDDGENGILPTWCDVNVSGIRVGVRRLARVVSRVHLLCLGDRQAAVDFPVHLFRDDRQTVRFQLIFVVIAGRYDPAVVIPQHVLRRNRTLKRWQTSVKLRVWVVLFFFYFNGGPDAKGKKWISLFSQDGTCLTYLLTPSSCRVFHTIHKLSNRRENL